MSKNPVPGYESIADLSLEERHAIVVSWLNTVTDFYQRAAEQRDELLAACMNFVWLGNNLHNIRESPDQFEQFYRAALGDVQAAIAKVEAQQ